MLICTQHDDPGGLSVNGFQEVDDACVLYCERFMEFLIDLLSQLPTRRYGFWNLFLDDFRFLNGFLKILL